MKIAFTVLASVFLLASASTFAESNKGGHDVGNAGESKILNLTKSSDLRGFKMQINDIPWQEIAHFGGGQTVKVKLMHEEICTGTYEISKPDIAFTWTQQLRSYVNTSHMPSRSMIERSNARLEKMIDIKLNLTHCDDGHAYTRVYRLDKRIDISSAAGVITGWNDIVPFTEEDGKILGMNVTREF